MGELLNIEEYIKLIVGLLILVDPIGNTPTYLSLTRGEMAKHRGLIILVTMIAFASILLAFLFAGNTIFSYFGLTIAGFQVAGGLLLLKVAYDMMTDNYGPELSHITERDSAIKLALVPLAIPIHAGPGAITMTVIYGGMHSTWDHTLLVAIVILIVTLISALVLVLAPLVEKLTGETGMHVLNQIMALIVAVIGAEFILDGIAAHFDIPIVDH